MANQMATMQNFTMSTISTPQNNLKSSRTNGANYHGNGNGNGNIVVYAEGAHQSASPSSFNKVVDFKKTNNSVEQVEGGGGPETQESETDETSYIESSESESLKFIDNASEDQVTVPGTGNLNESDHHMTDVIVSDDNMSLGENSDSNNDMSDSSNSTSSRSSSSDSSSGSGAAASCSVCFDVADPAGNESCGPQSQ